MYQMKKPSQHDEIAMWVSLKEKLNIRNQKVGWGKYQVQYWKCVKKQPITSDFVHVHEKRRVSSQGIQ